MSGEGVALKAAWIKLGLDGAVEDDIKELWYCTLMQAAARLEAEASTWDGWPEKQAAIRFSAEFIRPA